MKLKAKAYVKNNRLFIFGLAKSPNTPIPFAYSVECKAENGPIDFTSKKLPRQITKAIKKAQKVIMRRVTNDRMAIEATKLITRARAGDQNAMALMIMIRTNAEKGLPRAKKMYRLLKRSVKKNHFSDFGGEAIKTNHSIANKISGKINHSDSDIASTNLVLMANEIDPFKLGCSLAHGPKLYGKTDRVNELVKSVDESVRPLILQGIINWRNHNSHPLGRCIGIARTLQLVATNKLPIKALSSNIAWELGQ